MMKEKAIRQTAVPRKVKGTVLFTVVCVMMVLIVFLMGTLALAATANKRANTNFQREQANAYARTVLDAAMQAIDNDSGATGGFKEQIYNSTTPLTFAVDITEGGNTETHNVTVTKQGTKRIYSDSEGKWVDGNVYELKTSFDYASTGTEVEYCAYILDGFTTTSGGGGGGGGGGAFVSGGYTSGASTGGFLMGGSSIGIGESTPIPQVTMGNDEVFMAPFFANTSDLIINAQVYAYFDKMGAANYFAVEGDFHPNNNFKLVENPNSEWKTGTGYDYDYTQIPCIYVGGTFYQPDSNTTFSLGTAGTTATLPVNLYCGRFQSGGNPSKFDMTGDMYCFDADATSVIYNQNVGDIKLAKWFEREFKDVNGTVVRTKFANLYSLGSVEIGGVDVGSDCRVTKDLTVNKDITVGGDLVVGGTLTVNANVTVTGQIYAGKIVKNSGNINCAGSHTFEATNYTPTETYTGGGAVIGSKAVTTTYSNIVLTLQDASAPYEIKLTADYTKSTVTTLHGVAQPAETETGSLNENDLVYSLPGINLPAEPWYRQMTLQEYIDSGAWTKYNELTAKYNALIANPTETTSEDIYQYDIATKYGKEIYPSTFTQTNITTNIVKKPSMTDYDYPDEISEIDSGTIAAPTTYYPNDGSDITGSVILDNNPPGIGHGLANGTTIKIKANNAMIIHVKNFSMTASNMIIEGTAPVYFFIEGSLSLDDSKIVTSKIKTNILDQLAAGTDISVDQKQPSTSADDYPNVYFYSAKKTATSQPTLSVSNTRSFISGNIQAQNLKFTSGNGCYDFASSGATLTYNMTDDNGNAISYPLVMDGTKKAKIGLMGQLICDTADIGNEWTLLYVYVDTTGGGGGGGGGGGSRTVPDYYLNMYYNFY